MKTSRIRYPILLLLGAMFAAPGILAIYFYSHPDLLHQSTNNKGYLLERAYVMPALQESDKLHLLFLSQTPCKALCITQLENLAKVRLALGRRLYQVELNVILPESENLTEKQREKLKAMDFHPVYLKAEEVAALQTNITPFDIAIANAKGVLILSYDKKVNYADIYHDLKHLL